MVIMPFAPGFVLMLKIWLFGKISGYTYATAHAYLTERVRWPDTIDDIIQIHVQDQAVLLADE